MHYNPYRKFDLRAELRKNGADIRSRASSRLSSNNLEWINSQVTFGLPLRHILLFARLEISVISRQII